MVLSTFFEVTDLTESLEQRGKRADARTECNIVAE